MARDKPKTKKQESTANSPNLIKKETINPREERTYKPIRSSGVSGGAVALLLLSSGLPLFAQCGLADPTPAPAWVARYNGPGNGEDVAQKVVVRGSGENSVTGWSLGLGTGFDYATTKRDVSGNPIWTARYNGPGNGEDKAFALAVDASGNVYVTGKSWNGSNFDYATVKYRSTDGVQLWVATYNGPGNGNDEATAIALDSQGNVYVTGKSWNGSNFDYATTKYDVSGNPVWSGVVRRYNGPSNGEDRANAIVVDNNGDVVVTGASTGSGTDLDYATVKYRGSDGNQQWVARFNYQGFPDEALALVVDTVAPASGGPYVYVTGGFGLTAAVGTIKYNKDGVQQWVHTYIGTNKIQVGKAIALYPPDNPNPPDFVYVAGYQQEEPPCENCTGRDYLTLKYKAADGNFEWAVAYDGPAYPHQPDEAYAIGVDSVGNIYVTGESTGNGTGLDYATLKYARTPSFCWDARYNELSGNVPDSAYSLAVDGDGSVYVTGRSWDAATGFDYATIKYCLMLGDVDGDGDVDAQDLGIVQNCVGANCANMCCREDVNGDGIVDATDVSIVQSNLGKACLADALRRR